jgi:hypothetical protein
MLSLCLFSKGLNELEKHVFHVINHLDDTQISNFLFILKQTDDFFLFYGALPLEPHPGTF